MVFTQLSAVVLRIPLLLWLFFLFQIEIKVFRTKQIVYLNKCLLVASSDAIFTKSYWICTTCANCNLMTVIFCWQLANAFINLVDCYRFHVFHGVFHSIVSVCVSFHVARRCQIKLTRTCNCIADIGHCCMSYFTTVVLYVASVAWCACVQLYTHPYYAYGTFTSQSLYSSH